ncbi:hypothetical protein RJ639_006546 [Escallonia herrerae]|uniref:Pentatricopeptide repeat-containing protein n=1 Tax=Escallonia herrerae TaxID=1293975 RepID=A0AA88VWP1_9ASTE|nr:hypothetical protein RJ639_006546 [Escallonia herrerae]
MMKMELKPDFVTYMALLSMYTQLMNVLHAKELHCDIIKTGYDSTLAVGNALVDVYAKCGKLEDSLNQFENMKTRDIVTWNTIVAASKRRGKEIHGCILKLGFELDVPIGNALIEMYSKCGSLKNSVLVFKHMKTKDVVTWTAMISAYGMYGEGREALKAFEEMDTAGIVPDHIVFVAILYACSHSGLVKEIREVHINFLLRRIFILVSGTIGPYSFLCLLCDAPRFRWSGEMRRDRTPTAR